VSEPRAGSEEDSREFEEEADCVKNVVTVEKVKVEDEEERLHTG